jgi:transposase
MRTQAPSIRRDYPLAGTRIGPAWVDLWRGLHEEYWVVGTDLARKVAERHGLKQVTVQGLLQQARKARILAVRQMPGKGGKLTGEYRVISKRWCWYSDDPGNPTTGPLQFRPYGYSAKDDAETEERDIVLPGD